MKIIMGLLFLNFLTVAQAEVYKCHFTEPFISFNYDTKTAIVIKQNMGTNDTILSKKAKLVLTSGVQDELESEYLLKGDTNQTIAKLKFTNNGSDGMSDFRYPYDVWYGEHRGACFTDTRPVQNF